LSPSCLRMLRDIFNTQSGEDPRSRRDRFAQRSALAMLSDADIREHTILGAIGYSPNIVYLHRDAGPMPPPHLDLSGAVAVVLRAAAGHLQNRRGDPLGSVAALAQGGAAGATSGCRASETRLQYRLGERPTQRLYWDGVISRRAGARIAGSALVR
jgi:hypothetical protein